MKNTERHNYMQMVAGAAYIPDHLTSRHGFARRDGCCYHVGIFCVFVRDGLIIHFSHMDASIGLRPKAILRQLFHGNT